MSKKKRHRRQTRQPDVSSPPLWPDDEGLHALLPGRPPSQEVLDDMTQVYQQNIRNSPLWDVMVQEFGAEEAERMLQQFQVKLNERGV